MTNVTQERRVTAAEANELATGLVGAAAAERDETAKPAGRVSVGGADVHVDGPVAATAYHYSTGSTSGWVKVGPLAFHGTWDDLADFFAAGLAAVREQSSGPVGA